MRWWNVRLPRTYIDAVLSYGSAEDGRESLSPDERAGEALMLGLRLTSGIDLAAFIDRFGEEPLQRRARQIGRAVESGLLERTDGHLKLTERGAFVANEVFVDLL